MFYSVVLLYLCFRVGFLVIYQNTASRRVTSGGVASSSDNKNQKARERESEAENSKCVFRPHLGSISVSEAIKRGSLQIFYVLSLLLSLSRLPRCVLVRRAALESQLAQ